MLNIMCALSAWIYKFKNACLICNFKRIYTKLIFKQAREITAGVVLLKLGSHIHPRNIVIFLALESLPYNELN